MPATACNRILLLPQQLRARWEKGRTLAALVQNNS